MFIRLSLRSFWTFLLVVSTLWLAIVLLPLLYVMFSPDADFHAIVWALEMRQDPPLQAAEVVQQMIAAAGQLEGAVQIGYYSEVGLRFRREASHKVK
jgi:hypothetical protein